MTAHRWLTKRHSSLLSRACSTEGSCGSPSSRDRRRQHLLGRARRRGAAPRRIVRWLDRRRAHPRLLRASHPVFSSRAADKVGTRPPPSHSPPPTMHSPSTLAGKAHGTPNLGWKCRRHGLVAPSAAGQRHAAQNLRDKLATSVPRIHPRFCPIQAHPVPRATSRAKFAPFPTSSSRPNADLRPPGGPGRGSGPARCGFSTALRCICAPMARSGVCLRRVDCGAPR